ncbi:bile salt export pump-like [Sinocyclocheilus anshuiensis]|uniref:bile salt export pump-like n=1 Tax=Sinocyclocheilus anshuiensis TaxID=1608454 RepID=UPI0007BAD984|nr:PREDICTED: bile salt export pump-like [Sinocyclocheilus anshuiensis]
MPGTVKLRSIKKFGQENDGYEFSDEETNGDYMTMASGKDKRSKNEKKEEPAIRVGFFQLFRFSSCREICMMIFGSICAMIHGSAQPLMLLVFGMLTDTFIEYDIELNKLSDPDKVCVNNTIQRRNLTEEENLALNMTKSCGIILKGT